MTYIVIIGQYTASHDWPASGSEVDVFESGETSGVRLGSSIEDRVIAYDRLRSLGFARDDIRAKVVPLGYGGDGEMAAGRRYTSVDSTSGGEPK